MQDCERLFCFSCPHCGANVYQNISKPVDHVSCDHCGADVRTPFDKAREAVLFNVISKRLVQN